MLTHQFLVCLEHFRVFLLHLLQLHCAGEVLLVWYRTHREIGYFSHFMQHQSQFTEGGEEGPWSWKIQFKDGEKIGYTDFYPMAFGPDCFIESSPHQLRFKMLQNIQRQIPPPRLMSRMYPAGSPKILRWVVALDLDELVVGPMAFHSSFDDD